MTRSARWARASCRPTWFPTRRRSRLKLTVNGQIKQDATTAEMIFPVPAIVSFLSEFVTLQPGDVIATGTPSGVGSAIGHLPRARRLGPGHDRSDRHPGKPGRSRGRRRLRPTPISIDPSTRISLAP